MQEHLTVNVLCYNFEKNRGGFANNCIREKYAVGFDKKCIKYDFHKSLFNFFRDRSTRKGSAEENYIIKPNPNRIRKVNKEKRKLLQICINRKLNLAVRENHAAFCWRVYCLS